MAKNGKNGLLVKKLKNDRLFYNKKMALQIGIIKIRVTISGICFYKLYEGFYARKKSSLNSSRVKTSPAFRNTMVYANRLAKASVIGSEVYRLLPKEKRNRKLYQRITGIIMQLLKKGIEKEEIVGSLKKEMSRIGQMGI